MAVETDIVLLGFGVLRRSTDGIHAVVDSGMRQNGGEPVCILNWLTYLGCTPRVITSTPESNTCERIWGQGYGDSLLNYLGLCF